MGSGGSVDGTREFTVFDHDGRTTYLIKRSGDIPGQRGSIVDVARSPQRSGGIPGQRGSSVDAAGSPKRSGGIPGQRGSSVDAARSPSAKNGTHYIEHNGSRFEVKCVERGETRCLDESRKQLETELESLNKWELKEVHESVRKLKKKGLGKTDLVRSLIFTVDKAVAARNLQERTSHEAWKAVVPVPEEYRQDPHSIQDTAQRGVSLTQLESLGTFVEKVVENEEVRAQQLIKMKLAGEELVAATWKVMNLYIICDFFVKPLTMKAKCSFVELIAASIQVPTWFVSHWWGTPFRQSLRMLRLHSRVRKLAAAAYYWMCTFANNQHKLDELSGGLFNTPFMRVLRSEACTGTVALMDAAATPFSRVWCVLEAHESNQCRRRGGEPSAHPYDIAAWVPDNAQLRGDDDVPEQPVIQFDQGNGLLHEEAEEAAAFPGEVSEIGVDVDIRVAEASVDQDKQLIMAYIADGTGELNAAVQQRFAAVAMHSVAMHGDATKLRDLISRFPAQINAENQRGETPAHRAAENGHVGTLKALLEKRADVNKADHQSQTPAFLAAVFGHVDTLKALLDARADMDKALNNGHTPAIIAAGFGQVDTLKVLLDGRADMDKANHDGLTPAHAAAWYGHVDALRALLEARADTTVTYEGKTPLGLAEHCEHAEAAALLRAAAAASERK